MSRLAGALYWLTALLLVLFLATVVVLTIRPAALSVRQPGAPAIADWGQVDGPRAVIHTIVRAPWRTLYAGISPTGQALTGVYQSADGGIHWRPIGHPLLNTDAWAVTTLHHGAQDIVLAGAGDGYVYRLQRGPDLWERASEQIGTYGVFALAALPSGVVLAGSDRGIFHSTDDGRSWTQVYATGSEDTQVVSFAYDSAASAVYAGLLGAPRSLWLSRDDGRTWHALETPLPPNAQALVIASGRIYAGTMETQSRHPIPVWVGGAQGFRPFSDGLPSDERSHGMALAALGQRLFVGTMGDGVFSRTESIPWKRLGHGPGDGTIIALLALPGPHPTLFAGTAGGMYRLTL